MPHEMSGGEQQRACIARAIANEPMLLLADEPTGNLDPNVADEIHKLLLKLNRQGMTMIMATHDYRLIRKEPTRTLALTITPCHTCRNWTKANRNVRKMPTPSRAITINESSPPISGQLQTAYSRDLTNSKSDIRIGV